ncbi:MAG: trypsin-like peptidase domain-containing protein [Bacillota bacterium]|nr:trypsin-like peptidase domain-containing protein [Bacillota bacterium]
MKKSISIFLLVLIVVFAALVGGFFALTLEPVIERSQAHVSQAEANDMSRESPSTGKDEGEGLSPVAIGEILSGSVVGISNLADYKVGSPQEAQVEVSAGSGVIIDPRGYIVTNYHVISGSDSITVTLSDSSQTAASVVGADKRTDLALLKISGDDFTAAPLGDSDLVAVGETAIAIGNPGGLDFASSLTQGIISGLNRPLTTDEGLRFKLIQTDAAINPGNSGGALVNNKGEVIGINTIKISEEGFEGMGFALPSNLVRDIVAELMENGKVTRAAMGVYLLGSLGREYLPPQGVENGVVISVRPGGPGEVGGLMDNDIITAVDGNAISDIYELQEVIFDHAVGDTIEVEVYRGSAVKTCQVTLGELEEE